MSLRRGLAAGFTIALWLGVQAMAQEPSGQEPAGQEPAGQAPAGQAPAAPDAAPAKPKPRPKPKLRLKESKPSEIKPSEIKPAESTPAEAESREPQLRSGPADAETRPMPEPPELRTGRAPASPPSSSQDQVNRAAPAAPSPAPAPSPSQGAFAAPAVACDPGQSVLYDGPNGFALWVTRTGAVTIDNPLRPLTPDVTRVLQLVIAGKLATAYGPDLLALRRGPSPGALEGALGGPIKWDAALGTLPDTLNIVEDSGRTLAEMRFKECGTAPAAKAPPAPVAKKRDEKPRPARKAPPSEEAGARPPPGPPPGPPAAGAAPPRRLPQGALPE